MAVSARGSFFGWAIAASAGLRVERLAVGLSWQGRQVSRVGRFSPPAFPFAFRVSSACSLPWAVKTSLIFAIELSAIGPQKKELMHMVKSLGLELNVEFLGSMGGDQAFLGHLSEAAFMLLPCIQPKNGDLDVCPLVLQEAMCAGVPVVTTNISAIPELVEDGKQGLIVEPNDIQQLVSAIATMLLDRDLRTQMGRAGPEKIEQKFNIHKEVAKLLAIWQEVTGSKCRGESKDTIQCIVAR